MSLSTTLLFIAVNVFVGGQFASGVKKITNRPTVNISTEDPVIRELQRQLRDANVKLKSVQVTTVCMGHER